MMRRSGDAREYYSPGPRRFLNASNSDSNDVSYVYNTPVRLSFSTSSMADGADISSLNSSISSPSSSSLSSSSSTTTTPAERKLSRIDADALMKHVDECTLILKRNLTDLVRHEFDKLIKSLNPNEPNVPYPITSEENLSS